MAGTPIAVRRAGVPEDIAGTAAFLMNGDASFVSGQVPHVAGGPRG
ncbi:SDR family oxidoreductase [Actinomadura formosensis]